MAILVGARARLASALQRVSRRALPVLRDSYFAVDPRWLGLFRVCFGLLLLAELGNRWAYARLFFSNEGVLPNHYSLFAPMGSDLFSIYHAFSSVGEVHVAFTLTAVVFGLFTLGYKTRLAQVLSAVCITSLHSRNLFMENGGSVVTHSLAIWTVFLPLGRCFSLDALLASLRARPESSATELNARPAGPPEPFVSLVVLGLLLQWSAIYYLNAVQKDGAGWRDGTAIHWFLHQDRIVTGVGIFAREHLPLWAIQLMTHGTLLIERTLPLLLLLPFGARRYRLLALALALALHGSIALFSRLGPFSYAMVVFFLLLLGDRELRWLGRWFARPARRVSLVFDVTDARALLMCRWLKRLDPFGAVTFLELHAVDTWPPELRSLALGAHGFMALNASGEVFHGRDAVLAAVRGVPAGRLGALLLQVPGVSALLAHVEERLFAPAGQSAVRREWRALGGVSVGVREALALALMVTLATEVVKSNRVFSSHASWQRPEWMGKVIGYTRMLEGWSMFAPEPPYEDGRLVVDGRTADGRKLDPFTGQAPEFDPRSPHGWGHDQLWCDYSLAIRWPGHEHRRVFLSNYLQHQHVYSGRAQDRLVAFEVWWVSDRSPPPGERIGVPLPPEKLLAFGALPDSGAEPWLDRPQARH